MVVQIAEGSTRIASGSSGQRASPCLADAAPCISRNAVITGCQQPQPMLTAGAQRASGIVVV